MYFGHTFAEVEQKVKFKDKMKTNINKLSKCQGYIAIQYSRWYF